MLCVFSFIPKHLTRRSTVIISFNSGNMAHKHFLFYSFLISYFLFLIHSIMPTESDMPYFKLDFSVYANYN